MPLIVMPQRGQLGQCWSSVQRLRDQAAAGAPFRLRSFGGVRETNESPLHTPKSEATEEPGRFPSRAWLVLLFRPHQGAVAQLVARLVRNEKARGSNPLSSTNQARTGRAFRPVLASFLGWMGGSGG